MKTMYLIIGAAVVTLIAVVLVIFKRQALGGFFKKVHAEAQRLMSKKSKPIEQPVPVAPQA